MKKFVLCMLFFSTRILSVNQEISPNVAAESVNAAAQAIHENAVQGSGKIFLERCSEGIIVGIAVQLLGFIALDLYHGSKGYTYKMLFGLKPEERKMALEIEELKFKNEEQAIKIAEGHYNNYLIYKALMTQKIEQATQENEKAQLLERLKNTTEALTRKQEIALQGSRALKTR